jgi:hypothetical protein
VTLGSFPISADRIYRLVHHAHLIRSASPRAASVSEWKQRVPLCQQFPFFQRSGNCSSPPTPAIFASVKNTQFRAFFVFDRLFRDASVTTAAWLLPNLN